MKIRYKGATLKLDGTAKDAGSRVYDFVAKDLVTQSAFVAVSAPRLKRLEKELADRVDDEMANYFGQIYRAIMAQAKGVPLSSYGVGIPARAPLRGSTLRNKRAFRRRPWPVRFYGQEVPNTNILRFNPGLVGPDRHLVFTGNTLQAIRHSDWQQKLGRTQVELSPELRRLAAESDAFRYPGQRSVGRAVQLKTISRTKFQGLLGEIVVRVAPRQNLTGLSQTGDDPLADRLFTGRTAVLLKDKRILSPVMRFMLQKQIPRAVDKFTRRVATIVYNRIN